jgi:hypothetical protein
MARDLALEGQTGWTYYDGADCPEGAYMGWLYPNVPSRAASLVFGRTLNPGRYRVFFKVLDYAGTGAVDLSFGGATTRIQTLNRDWNGYWTASGFHDVKVATSTMTITLVKTVPLENEQKYLLEGFYITNDTEETVTAYDRILRLRYPMTSEIDTIPAVKGNILENSSFEVGTGHGWGILNEGYDRDFTLPSLLDTTVAYHGTASLRVTDKIEVISKAYKVNPNKTYTLSVWLKASGYTPGTLSIYNPLGVPPGYQSPPTLSTAFAVGTAWQRVTLRGVLLSYPTNDYQIRIWINNAKGAGVYTWIDAIQLEEGDLSPYSTKTPIEIGLVSNRLGNIFFENELVTMDLLAHNTGDAASAKVAYEIYDHMNNKVNQGAATVSLPPRSTSKTSLDCALGKRGVFRILLWVDSQDGTAEEVTYSIIPPPRNSGVDQSSIIGIHPNLVTFQLAILQKLGMKWGRAMSPSTVFRWSIIEPEEGKFVWYDAQVQKAIDHGVTVMGTLGVDKLWPPWADRAGLPDLDKWERFVEQVVTHYKAQVKYWEIWNEPNYVFTPTFYAEILKRAASVIRRVDPSAKIVGIGGVFSDTWIVDVMKLLGDNPTSYFDYISTHLYGTDPQFVKRIKTNVIDRYNVEVWNTETGVWDSGLYQGTNSNFLREGEPIWPHLDAERYYQGSVGAAEQLVVNFFHTIGNGVTRYFYYDSRLYATPAYLKHHPTILEYDDTIRPKGIAYSIIAHLFDKARGLGNISIDPTTYAYLFDRAGTPLVALWSSDRKERLITPTTSQFRVYDLMGNPVAISGSTIRFNGSPVYVEGQGISIELFKSAFQKASISPSSDTIVPRVAVTGAPTGSFNDKVIGIRWIGLDNVSLPAATSPNAIQYSYRLVGRDNSWSPWTAATYVEYADLLPGSYTFSIKAKDEAGNVTEEVRRPIVRRSVRSPSPILVQ